MGELPTGTVTFLLTDIEGSTRLWEEHPDVMPRALARHDAVAAQSIARHDGLLLKHRGEGDSLFGVFSRAADAVEAACALQRALFAEPWPAETPLRVRIALHTGEADLRSGDYYGPTVNRCARLRAVAHGGQILLSQATYELVRDMLPPEVSLKPLGAHRLKDLQRPEQVFQLTYPSLPTDFPSLNSLDARRHNLPVQLTRFIGRETEIAHLRELLAGGADEGVKGRTGEEVTEDPTFTPSPLHSFTPSAPGRLVTLTGSGGCGKTRLALQVAADLVDDYTDGVWLVEMAPLADATFVAQYVASILRIREEPGLPLMESLTAALRTKSLLLILDNCEHLLGACASLASMLLQQCPRLQILATSREALGVPSECVWRVPSLSLPEPRQPLDRLTQYEAVRLFIDRAASSQPEFSVTNENAPAVAEICSRLDGIPLAIELAAARVTALPVEEIAARLDDRFRLLTGGPQELRPRQQTLSATMDWSYDLLQEPERLLLQRLSVFAGSFNLAAAEGVCARPGLEPREIVLLLGHLAGKSLLIVEEPAHRADGEQPGWAAIPGAGLGHGAAAVQESEPLHWRKERRYRLLETVRQYAAERLRDTSEALCFRDQHRDWYLTLAETAAAEMEGPQQAEWLALLETEHDNLRTALAWSAARAEAEQKQRGGGVRALMRWASGSPWAALRLWTMEDTLTAGLRLGGALGPFWRMRGYWTEGRERLQELISLAGLKPQRRTLLGLFSLPFGERLSFRGFALVLVPIILIGANMSQPDPHWGHIYTLPLNTLDWLGRWWWVYWILIGVLQTPWFFRRLTWLWDWVLQLESPRVPALLLGSLLLSAPLLQLAVLLARAGGWAELAVDPLFTAIWAVPALICEALLLSELLARFMAHAQASRGRALALALQAAAQLAAAQGDAGPAQAIGEEVLATYQLLDDAPGVAEAIRDVAMRQLGEGGDVELAEKQGRLALWLRQRQGNQRKIAESFSDLGAVALARDQPAKAAALYEQSLSMRRDLDDAYGIAESLHGLGKARLYLGEKPEGARALSTGSSTLGEEEAQRPSLERRARKVEEEGPPLPLLRESLAAARPRALEEEEKRREDETRRLAIKRRAKGDEQAERLFLESLEIRRKLRDPGGVAECLESLAAVARTSDAEEARHAAQLLGAAAALRGSIRARLSVREQKAHDANVSAVRAALGEEAFQVAHAEGERMTLDEAATFALAGTAALAANPGQ